MSRRRIGQIVYWLGVVGLGLFYFMTWISNPIQRVNTVEELSGTAWAAPLRIPFRDREPWGVSWSSTSTLWCAALFRKERLSFLAMGICASHRISHRIKLDTISIHTTNIWYRRGDNPCFVFWNTVGLDEIFHQI